MRPPSDEFYRIKKLPPYVFAVINELRDEARARGEDIIDLGMGNPDGATPEPVVERLIEAARDPLNHRYSVSRGIRPLREAIVERYGAEYGVHLDADKQAIVTMGAKDALAHLLLAILAPGDAVVSPNPAYPLHQFGVTMAEGEAQMLPMPDPETFLDALRQHLRSAAKQPKVILISFPHNPTTLCVDLAYMREVVALAQRHGCYIVHDLAYSELAFDGYRPPSILQVEGAVEHAVEIYSMTKTFNMAGWRVGYCLGNPRLIAALTRMKSYLDYGLFQPIQMAAVTALRDCPNAPRLIRDVYQARRDAFIPALAEAGWPIAPPRATMFAWAPMPEPFRHLGSLEFAKFLMREARVAVSPGIGFGPMGEGFVRFSLIEDRERLLEAASRIGRVLQDQTALAGSRLDPAHV